MTCPECGHPIAEVGIVEPGEVDSLFIRNLSRRRKIAAGWLFVGLAAAGTALLLAFGVLDWRVFILVYGICLLGVWTTAEYLRARQPERYTGRSCPHCGYSMTGNTSGVCPECGNKISTGPEQTWR